MHRAYDIQVQNPENYERRYREEIEVEAKRGNIYDRRGRRAGGQRRARQRVSPTRSPCATTRSTPPPRHSARSCSGICEAPWRRSSRSTSASFGSSAGSRPRSPRPSRSSGYSARASAPARSPSLLPERHDGGARARLHQRSGARASRARAHVRDAPARAVDKVAAILDARGGVVFSEELVADPRAQGHSLTLTLDVKSRSSPSASSSWPCARSRRGRATWS